MSPMAYTVRQFCAAYGISKSTFYRLQQRGEGPRTMKVGRRVLIPVDAAKEWERKRLNRQSDE